MPTTAVPPEAGAGNGNDDELLAEMVKQESVGSADGVTGEWTQHTGPSSTRAARAPASAARARAKSSRGASAPGRSAPTSASTQRAVPKTSRSQKLLHRQQQLLREHPSHAARSATPPARSAQMESSSADTAPVYGGFLPPGRVLKGSHAPPHRKPQQCCDAVASAGELLYAVQRSQLHPLHPRRRQTHASGGNRSRSSSRGRLGDQRTPLPRGPGAVAAASTAHRSAGTLTPRGKSNATSTEDATALQPLAGLTAMQQQLQPAAPFSATAYTHAASQLSRPVELAASSPAEALSRAILKSAAQPHAASDASAPCEPQRPASEAPTAAAAAAAEAAQIVRCLYEIEVNRAAFAQVRPSKTAGPATPAHGGQADHADTEPVPPLDYQSAFHDVLHPRDLGSRADPLEDDAAELSADDGDAACRYADGQAALATGALPLSTHAAALLQDPLTLLACEHLLEETSHNSLSASATTTSKAVKNSTDSRDVQSWIAEANARTQAADESAPRGLDNGCASAPAAKAVVGPLGIVLREAPGPVPSGTAARLPLAMRSVLQAVPPPGEVFAELSYAAKVLLSVILNVRALGGLPTLLRVGPLTDMSPVVDKENCIELVFWNPRSSAAESDRDAAQTSAGSRTTRGTENWLSQEHRTSRHSPLDLHDGEESASASSPIAHRLVRTLSTVLSGGSAAAERAATYMESSPRSNSASTPGSAFTTPAPALAATSTDTSFRAFNARARAGDSTPVSAPGGGGAAHPSSSNINNRAHRLSAVTFDGAASLLGCEHDASLAVPRVHRRASTAAQTAASAAERDVMLSVGDGTQTHSTPPLPAASSPQGLRRSSSSVSFHAADYSAAQSPLAASTVRLPSNDDPLGVWGAKPTEARLPPAPPTGKGLPLIRDGEDELCVVLRAMVAQKSTVDRFGEREVVHVLPPLPQEDDDVHRQLLRDAVLDKLAVRDADPLYRFLQSEDARKEAQEKRKAVLLQRQRRLRARGPVAIAEDGSPPPADYGDLVIAMLLSGGASQLSGVLPDAMELEGLRYRIFSLQGYSAKDPYGIAARKQAAAAPVQPVVQSPALAALWARDGADGVSRPGSVTVSPSISFAARSPQEEAPSVGVASPSLRVRRESSFQLELSRTFGIEPSVNAYGDNLDASPTTLREASRITHYTAALEAKEAKRRAQAEEQVADAHARAFPLYRASSVSERTLAAYQAAELSAARARRQRKMDGLQRCRSLSRSADAHRTHSARKTPPPQPQSSHEFHSDDDGHAGHIDSTHHVSLRGEFERSLLQFRPLQLTSFYAELCESVQYALDLQSRQTQDAIIHAFHM